MVFKYIPYWAALTVQQTATFGSWIFAYSRTRIHKQIILRSNSVSLLDVFPQKPSLHTSSANKTIPFHTNRHFD